MGRRPAGFSTYALLNNDGRESADGVRPEHRDPRIGGCRRTGVSTGAKLVSVESGGHWFLGHDADVRVRSRLVLFRSRLGSSLGRSLARAADPSPAVGLACDASVRRPVGGPPALARDGAFRRVAFHPYQGATSAWNVASPGAEKPREPSGGSDAPNGASH
jgi:hypothetical protein